MANLNVTVGSRIRKSTNAAGKEIRRKVYNVNYRCPETGRRKQPEFPTNLKAEEYRETLIAAISGEHYFDRRSNPSVSEAVDHWIGARRGSVKRQTITGYRPLLKIIVGPLLQGTPQERVHYALTGEKPRRDTKLLLMLGDYKVSELMTAQLRKWHNLVREEVGAHTANRVMSMFKGILALTEEDFGVRTCKIPTNLARRKVKPRKEILTPDEVAKLLNYAKTDSERGIYCAFPFLTGVRVSEQLGLLWSDIDFDKNCIQIQRVQERDGTTTDTTKTEAGTREIPISASLRSMLLEWRVTCPRLDGDLHRVFPGIGTAQQWPLPRKGGGGPLLYSNFLHRFWQKSFERSGIRYVTHHSARHSFVSVLQAQGVEVGLVAKLAGHSNPAVTLGHYTQAVRGGAEALAMLDKAYQGE